MNKFWMFIDIVNQAICILTHLKEICLFLCRVHWSPTIWTFAIHKLTLCKKGLAGCTIHSLISSLINIPLVVKLSKNLLHLLFMIFIGCSNKFIIGSVHQIPNFFNLPGNLIDMFLWCDSCRLGL